MKTTERALPVRKNDRLELTITALGAQGQGIGRHQGFVVFVPFALPGERVEVHIIKATASYAVGKLIAVLEASPDRVMARCPVFGRCGGCQLQHLSYEAQLEHKRRQVEDALRTIGGVSIPVPPTVGMAEPWEYRNKAIFPVGQGQDGVELGMYAPHSHTIVPTDCCPIQAAESEGFLAAIRQWARDWGVPAYDEETGRGVLRHAMLRSFGATGQSMAVIVTAGDTLPAQDALVAALRAAVPSLVGVVQNINPERTNVVLGQRERLLWGEPSVVAQLSSLRFQVVPQSFFQVNTTQTERLYAIAGEFAALTGDELVVDAYCGVGTIGQSMASKAGRVIGIESVPQAVEEARRSAARNGIANVEYHCGRAEDVFASMAADGLRPDVIVMDPPRRGCDEAFLQAVAQTHAPRLVYVSCNPATLARDVKILRGLGYELAAVQPVDMFPQTEHVETVVLLSGQKQ